MKTLPIEFFCPTQCLCGKGGGVRQSSSPETSTSTQHAPPLVVSANAKHAADIDWDATLKHCAQIYGLETALVAVLAPKCPTKKECTEKLHTLGKFGNEPNMLVITSCEVISLQHSLTYQCTVQNKIMVSNDIAGDERISRDRNLQKVAAEMTLRSCICVPLKTPDDVVVGVFACGSSKEIHEEAVNELLCFISFCALMVQVWQQAEQIEHLNTEMNQVSNQSLEYVKQSTLTRDTFIATMSHEIRTPLTSIIAANQLLTVTDISKENEVKIRHLLSVQQTCSVQLLELINDILDFCKLRSTSMQLIDEEVQLDSLITQIAQIYTEQCRLKMVEMHVDVNQVKDLRVIGDRKRLKQIIINLLNNALKFTQKGTITIKAEVFKSENNVQDICVSVIDTGTGINPEHIHYIFEPYFSVKPNEPSTGVGLGLAITKEIVSLMGGAIDVESDGSTGTLVKFTIPLRNSNYIAQMLESNDGKRLKHLPVLILDDRVEQRMVMLRYVTRWGMSAHLCTCTSEGIIALEIMKEKFKIALVDVDLSQAEPNDTGVIFAQYVRQNRLDMKLIAVSSVGESFGGSQLFDFVLLKPLTEIKLYDTVNAGLAIQRPLRNRSLSRRESFITVHPPSRRTSLVNSEEPHILVVDDNDTNASIFVEMLQKLDYKHVEKVNSATECLFALTHNEYNVIFMDVIMPGMNGIECVKKIRKNTQRYGTPKIIALTADGVDSTQFRCLQNGFDYFLLKPVSLEDLKTATKWVLA